MFDDIQTSFKAALYERIGNPLLSAFAISWMIWNFKFLLVIFSGMEYWQKISYVGDLYPSLWEILGFGLASPLISAILYVFVFPYINIWVISHTEEHRKKLIEEKLKHARETPIAAEAASILRDGLLNLKQELNEERKARYDEVDSLNKTIKSVESNVAKEIRNSYEDQLTVRNDEISRLNKRISALEKENEKLMGIANPHDQDASDSSQRNERGAEEGDVALTLDHLNVLKDLANLAPSGKPIETIEFDQAYSDKLALYEILTNLSTLGFIKLDALNEYISLTDKGRRYILRL